VPSERVAIGVCKVRWRVPDYNFTGTFTDCSYLSDHWVSVNLQVQGIAVFDPDSCYVQPAPQSPQYGCPS
jgi:hypothetical protein